MDKTKKVINKDFLIIIFFFLVGLWLGILSGIALSVSRENNVRYEESDVLAAANVGLNRDILMIKVNEYRIKSGKNAFVGLPSLCAVAEKRLAEVIDNFNHKTLEWIVPGAREYGEILARYFENEGDTLNGWLESPTHKLVLDDDYKFGCIATRKKYAVGLFANY